MVFLFPPLKPPSPQISVAKVLIVCFCHDKRLRVFLSLIQLFFTISIVVLIFVFFFKMAVFFLFLRNVLLPIEILKTKILEHSDPPSQHFFVHKAFSHSFFCRGKVVLCHLAEWHTLPGQVSINVPIDRITPGYRQVGIQFSVTNLTNRIRK